MARMLAVFAEYERELISERTRAALAVKKAQGVPIGRPRSIDERVRKRIKRMRSRNGSVGDRWSSKRRGDPDRSLGAAVVSEHGEAGGLGTLT